MNTGTQASDGIGISALASGRKKPSTRRKRPIRMPSGRPTATASPMPSKTRFKVLAAWPGRLPSSTPSTKARPTAGNVGSSAAGKRPLRAVAS